MTRFADEISQQLRNLMLLKTAPDDPELLACMPDELEQLRSIAEQMPLPAVLQALSEVRACCDRMTRAGNRRMELEMTLIRLCSEEIGQKGDVKALEKRIAALEQQIRSMMQNGVPAAQPVLQKPAPKRNVPAQDLQVEGKPDTAQYTPVKNWATVLERFDEVNPSVSGLLQGSNAFVIEEQNILLMIVRNRLFKKLFMKQDAVALGEAAAQVLGRKYAIRFKCVESEEDKAAPVDVLLERAKAQGIAVDTRQDNA